MPASGQPQLRVLVIDQQDVAIVHHREVRNQMFRRRGGLGCAKQFSAGIDPGQRVFKVPTFERIQGRNGGDFAPDLVAQVQNRKYNMLYII